MKIRNGFVSNSSSSSFIIYNKTKSKKKMTTFVKEMEYVIDETNKIYKWKNSLDELIEGAYGYKDLAPGINTESFGDEDGTLIGQVFDYGLRLIKRSKSFVTICTRCHGSEYTHIVRVKNTSGKIKNIQAMLSPLTSIDKFGSNFNLIMMNNEIGLVAPTEYAEFVIDEDYCGNWDEAMHALLLKTKKYQKYEIEIETLPIDQYINKYIKGEK